MKRYTGDDLVVNETFGSTSKTFTHDPAGNLVDDAQFVYTYDAWHRLVKAERVADDGQGGTDKMTIQTTEFDGLGHRIKKTVTNTGDLDGTFVYHYDAQKIIEIRDGSDNVLQQAYHGTQYIDEIVAMKLEHGYAVVHQDANWNTVATTDLAGTVLERIFYTPYGQPTIEAETTFGDYDADGDVDSTDDANLGSGATCWGASPTGACRVFDFDQDGDIDADDQTVMTSLVNLPTTNHRHHNRTLSPNGLPFLHQGLYWDAELRQYQNRARQYEPQLQRFAQRDPLAFLNPSFTVREHYPHGMNLHQYVGRNPVTVVDPSGMYCLTSPYACFCFCGGLKIGVAAGTCVCCGFLPSAGKVAAAWAFLEYLEFCCAYSCMVGCCNPNGQPVAQQACVQSGLRGGFGPGIWCTCT